MTLLLLTACGPEPATDDAATLNPSDSQPEALSFDGRPLFPPPETEASQRKKDSLLLIARRNYEADPDKLENIIWLGRRTAYLSRYREAIDIFTQGLEKFPDAPKLYRHRGHRYLSTRQLDEAIADFERAAALLGDRPIEIEPDGLPNRLNIPLSNLQFNIYYHWGLAHYLQGEFEKAAKRYETCMIYSENPDLLTATADWLYMTYRRLGKDDLATQVLALIDTDLEIIENESYYNRLLMYKGLKQPGDLLDLDNDDPDAQLDVVTQGYGVGNWYLYNGDTARALQIYDRVLATGYWAAFGYLAAEADRKRLENVK